MLGILHQIVYKEIVKTENGIKIYISYQWTVSEEVS